MSDTLKKVIPIYLFIIIYILINVFMSFTSLKDIYSLFISPFIMLLVVVLTFVLTKNLKLKNREKYLKSKSIIKAIVIYIIICFFTGLIIGFKNNIYLDNFINTFISIFLVIFFKECIRHKLICFSKSKTNLLLLSFFMILFDISLFGLFEYLLIIILTNIISTYIIFKINALTNYIYIIFLLIFSLYVPIVPNCNILMISLYFLILLLGLYFCTDKLVKLEEKDKYRKSKKNLIGCYSFYLLSLFFILFMFGIFKYQPIAILSDSMKDYYSKGDAVIIEKISKEDIYFIEKNDIIYYRYDNRYITHRVYDIKVVDGSYVFYTKGDNNQYVDDWTISEDDIVGVVRLRVKYIGWPAVWLYDVLS